MSEMVERVARTLCLRHYRDRFPQMADESIQRNVDGNWHLFTKEARTAIEAMREPTSKMVERGLDWADGWADAARQCWQVMIDAAL